MAIAQVAKSKDKHYLTNTERKNKHPEFKAEIEQRSKMSTMPKGLHDRINRE